MAAYCANCGTELEAGCGFCPECGSPVVQVASGGQRETQPRQQEHRPAGAVSPAGAGGRGGSRLIEALRRIPTLAILVVMLVALAMGDLVVAALLGIAAILIYVLLPRITIPDGAYTYERIPAVIGPDILGFFMTSVFIALPFMASALEGAEWGDLFDEIHPSALLVWPLALISGIILYIAYRYANFWLKIEKDGLRIRTVSGEKFAAFSQIRQVAPHRRGLPRWMKALTPFLILGGKYGAAGSIMLARDETGIRLEMRDGTSITIAADALEKPFRKIMAALVRHDVAMTPELRAALASK